MYRILIFQLYTANNIFFISVLLPIKSQFKFGLFVYFVYLVILKVKLGIQGPLNLLLY